MGKSIRSKAKRKHRTEFRNTIGTVAYDKQMSKIQGNLKNCIDKQSTSMEGLTRLSKQLGNNDLPEPQSFDDMNERNNNSMEEDGTSKEQGIVDAEETTTANVKDLKGENKAPKRKKGRNGKKYTDMMRTRGAQKRGLNKEKRKPKFFCSF